VELREPLHKLVGGATAKVLADALDLNTVGDLLRHYPRRYATRGELTDLSSLRVDEHVTVLAEVRSARTRPIRSNRVQGRRSEILEVVVTDRRGELDLAFFAKTRYHKAQLRPGRRGLFAGKVGVFRGRRQLAHPEYELLPDESVTGDEAAVAQAAVAFLEELIPVYPATAKLPSWQIRKCAAMALDMLDELTDPLPAQLRRSHRLLAIGQAFERIHRPKTEDDYIQARRRFAWEEAFILQVELARRRVETRRLAAVPRHDRPDGIRAAFDAQLPFALTVGQRAVARDIADDLARPYPMHRLLQGEVGSGKTVVALRAMLTVVDSGGQAALLAPTEVLAQQHYRSISQLLGPLGSGGRLGAAENATRIALLTGSQRIAAKRGELLDLITGDAGIVVGTHALLEEHVQFLDLGLVVVDEQHRFGVEQRARLTGKADKPPHLLVMTATPIPRTVAMTVFGDLDVSTLAELPAGRSSIATYVVPAAEKPAYLERTWQRLREEVAGGHQAYVVCPRIGDGSDGEETDADDAPIDLADAPRRPPLALLDVAEMLAQAPLAGLRMERLHGRLPAETKEDVMRRFTDGSVDVLVATSVIEVGVDVPEATVMVIMDAERFGVAQLHQLRGRVGRGEAAGLCLLVTEAAPGTPARERLEAVAATTDGFELSRLDLEQRREGDVLGAAQAGRRSSLRILAVLRDEKLIRQARAEATSLVDDDPDLARHPELAAAIADLVDPDRAGFIEKT
jgi:ATP-dependent DNA helicase RecG